MKSLNGKSIFVTGGSRGIGQAIVKELAQVGAHVGFTYTANRESAESLLQELPGENHHIFELNLRNENSIKECTKKVLETYQGQIYGLVNNAGVTNDQILLRMKTEDFDNVIETNLRGTFLCTQAFLKNMVKARQGNIVNITSVIGQTGNTGQANYAASKAGIEAFTKSLAKELGSRNIRANCIAPGFIQTDMTKSMTETQQEKLMEQIPLQRLGNPNDIAKAVVFLLGEESSYVTGQTLGVNGGMYM